MNSQIKNCSINFNGHNSYVKIENPPITTNSMTISCWAKSETANWDREAMLLCKRNGYMIATNKGNKIIRFYIYSNGWQYALSKPDIDITQWHNYSGTFDGEVIRFYIDGEEMDCTYFQGEIHRDNNPLYIGYDNLRNSYFKGQITEVCIWDKAKSAGEIKADINLQLEGKEPNLVGYYPLNSEDDKLSRDVKIINADLLNNYPKNLTKITKIQTYIIQNLESELFLDIPAGNPSEATIIWGHTYNGGVGQQWIITPEGIIKSILGEFALDLKEIPDFPWVKQVIIIPVSGLLSQQWTIEHNGVIKNKSNQFALTIVAQNDYQIAFAYPVDESQLKPNETWQVIPYQTIEDCSHQEFST
ncbi:LamG-like jellyroll fold domain-containing protein [Crocosphaera sp. Alani8]|uniref:LamG-like jellyroll fold domain-containing protein n=1 Tax=Crocosphaera sp. Alani8 TaxID=3038952 RepID=UPI00313EE849